MIRLNKKAAIGTVVEIPCNLSWQVDKISGKYIIVAIEPDCYCIESCKTGEKITIDRIGIEYLTGTSVRYEYGVAYSVDKGYYPEKSDSTYVTDDESEPGFWYLAIRGNKKHITFDEGTFDRFFYIKYPDDWD